MPLLTARYGDSVDNTVENSSVFFLIEKMRWLLTHSAASTRLVPSEDFGQTSVPQINQSGAR